MCTMTNDRAFRCSYFLCFIVLGTFVLYTYWYNLAVAGFCLTLSFWVWFWANVILLCLCLHAYLYDLKEGISRSVERVTLLQQRENQLCECFFFSVKYMKELKSFFSDDIRFGCLYLTFFNMCLCVFVFGIVSHQ